ncbi:MAG: ATP-binding domain-containing protein [Deltaproteobacteria bacterium]|nr:ATP-binding domain-containing protein [Deltaproteobacteria bacterium]
MLHPPDHHSRPTPSGGPNPERPGRVPRVSPRRSPSVPPPHQRQRPRQQRQPWLRIAQQERALCRRVVGQLRAVRPPGPPRWNDDADLISLRDQLATARLEDVPALVTQMQQVQAILDQRARHVVESVDPDCPYFGHLRLDEAGRGCRDVLVGKATYLDPRHDIRIVDWRHAPISQLYYRYAEGASYEEEFGDREVQGRIVARRTVTIAQGELVRVACPQGTLVRDAAGHWRRVPGRSAHLAGGEGVAVRPDQYYRRDGSEAPTAGGVARRGVLGATSPIEQRENRHLPEIAALLDPRQFELIARPEAGLVAVQGAAGSGKTTIGVHRMAVLNFQAPERFAPEKMLVIVGTPALRAYISELLPALGIGAVRVLTFAEWARRARLRCYPWLTVRAEQATPPVVTRLKTDAALLGPLEARARELGMSPARADPRRALWLWAELLTDREALQRAFAAHGSRALAPAQIDQAWRYCAQRCPAVLDWGSEDDRAVRPADEDGNPIVGADGRLDEPDEHARLDPEDDALLLRVYQLLCEPHRVERRLARCAHLFVDEAQDLAPVDLAVLLGIAGEPQSVTLAGDTAQRMSTDTGFSDWSGVLPQISRGGAQIELLRIAYRSTREVLAFARAVLGPLAEEEPPTVPRSGAPVEHHHFPAQGAAAAFLAEALRPLSVREPCATVAVLARHAEQADAYYEALRMAEVPLLRRVRDYDFLFRPGVEVTEIHQVKGLEYDYVVLVDVNAATFPAEDRARHLLHIGATRAAHQLWVISTSRPSPLIPAWLAAEPG